MQEHLFDQKTSLFTDGLDISHSAWHATVFPLYASRTYFSFTDQTRRWFGLIPDYAISSTLAELKSLRMKGSVYAAFPVLHGLYGIGDNGTLVTLKTYIASSCF